MPALAAIALGSNQGDRRAHIDSALRAIAALPGTRVIAASPPIETTPVGMPPGEPNFINAAALLQTDLSPRDLLNHLLRIERDHGRNRTPGQQRGGGGWQGRTLDLDLLTYADLIIDEPGLTIPHPRLHQRSFVLEPLAAIAPHLVIPTLGRTVQELLGELHASSRINPVEPPP